MTDLQGHRDHDWEPGHATLQLLLRSTIPLTLTQSIATFYFKMSLGSVPLRPDQVSPSQSAC